MTLQQAFKQHYFRILISLLIITLFGAHVAGVLNLDFVDSVERQAYDFRLNSTLKYAEIPEEGEKESGIVIVDIDEKSLGEIGRWPWGRHVLADIQDQLFDKYHISILAFDAVFAEPDSSSGLKSLEKLAKNQLKNEPSFHATLAKLREELNYDQRFAESIKRHKRIVLGYSMTGKADRNDEVEKIGQLPKTQLNAEDLSHFPHRAPVAIGYASNLKAFEAASAASGHFNSYPDPDGISRRVPLLYNYDGRLYESLALAIARISTGEQFIEPVLVPNGDKQNLVGLKVGHHTMPVNHYYEAFIPYLGKSHVFRYISAVDVLKGQVEHPDDLRNSIVLFGATAHGLYDLRSTPVEEVYPGVEIHANLIHGIIHNHILKPAYQGDGSELFFLIVSAVFMLLFTLRFSPLSITLTAIILSSLVIVTNYGFWLELKIVVPIAATLMMILCLFLFNVSYGYFIETRNKRQITGLFGQYVPPQLVEEMSNNPQASFSMEGDSREMTVLFSDVRGFTSISEGLSPKQLSQLMNTFLTPMTHVIHEHRGTIDKYMGDAIMSFWGAPLADENHARHALNAGMAMLAKLETMQAEFKNHGWPEIRIGVGLNTGVMNVGNMGSEFRMAYTVLGDTVNLGSRLEGLTKQYGVPIIVNETTRDHVPEYLYRELDRVRVKGKEQPVAIFEPIGLKTKIDTETETTLQDYHQALASYRQRKWSEAARLLQRLSTDDEDRLIYTIYLDRIAHFQKHPVDEKWDGVFTHTTK